MELIVGQEKVGGADDGAGGDARDERRQAGPPQNDVGIELEHSSDHGSQGSGQHRDSESPWFLENRIGPLFLRHRVTSCYQF